MAKIGSLAATSATNSLAWRLTDLGLSFQLAFAIQRLIQDTVSNANNIIAHAPASPPLTLFSPNRVPSTMVHLHWHSARPYLKVIQERLQDFLNETDVFEARRCRKSFVVRRYAEIFSELLERLRAFRGLEVEKDEMVLMEYLGLVVAIRKCARGLLEPERWYEG